MIILITEFLSYLESQKRCSKNTILSYNNDLLSAAIYFNKTYAISQIDQVSFFHIRSYIVSLLTGGMSSKSVNRKISSLRSFYKYLMKKSCVDSNPMLKVVAPKVSKRLPDYVSKIDMSKLFDSLSFDKSFKEARNYMIILLLYNTGMRKAELIGLQDQDINYLQKRISVTGKGNKQRMVPISEHLIVKLKEYLQIRNQSFDSRDNTLLLTEKGKTMYPKLVYNIVNRVLLQIATNTKKSPHILRHTFATHMANNGAELNAIKELLGHASLAATQVYTHNSIQKLKDVHSRSHPKAQT